jgi:hypothetical protein
MSNIVYGAITLALCYVLACRIDKMVRGETRPGVFWQHAILGVSLMGSWLLSFTSYADWSGPTLAGGVFAFFMFSTRRWRGKAPVGTNLAELPPEALRHVAGGKR